MGFRGGSYREIHALPHGGRLHCHHIIPRESLLAVGLDPNLGPVIQIVDDDHRDTDTWGRLKRAQDARARITDMLRRDDYDGALQAGIEDIRSNFGDRYDGAIAEARRYYPTWRRTTTASTGAVPTGAVPTGGADHTGGPTAAGSGDVTVLVTRLTHYLETLDRHNRSIQQAYDRACESLANLQRVWGGEAARDFYAHFGSTTEALERYLEGSKGIRAVLEERLAALREADRPAV